MHLRRRNLQNEMRERLGPRPRLPRLGCEQALLYVLLGVLLLALAWGFAQAWSGCAGGLVDGAVQLAGLLPWPGDYPTATPTRIVVWTPEVFPTYTPTPTRPPTATGSASTATPTPGTPRPTPKPGATPTASTTPVPSPAGFDYVVESKTQQQAPGQAGVCAGKITGRVLDAAGQPVVGIHVEARWGSGPDDRALVPRPGDSPFSGAFEFCLGPGSFDITVVDGDKRSQAAHVDVPRLEGQVVVCEVNFRRTY